jgi:riboflavin kinase/FMN adenylyltransferase
MKVFQHFHRDTHKTPGAVVAIGNFDGVHRGHRALLEAAQDAARKSPARFGVLTFEPHTRRLFRPDEPPNRITPMALKHERLKAAGVEILFSLNFDWDFASQSADDFVHKVLIEGIGASHVVVGHDFRFGQLRKGQPSDIEKAGIACTLIDPQKDEDGEVLSSSRIRQLLRQGDLAKANSILGWDWEIMGVVGKGDQRGRDLGYPTANIPLGDTVHPRYGIYAAMVQIEGEDEWRMAATNIGIRPMFALAEGRVETFILDYEGDLYGRTMRVKPVQYLRGEAKFESLDDLKNQMAQDCLQARDILTSHR